MRHLVLVAMLSLWLVGSATADEIHANIEKIDGDTVVSCSPLQKGDIDRAYFTLYETDDNVLSVSRQEMTVSRDNIATYRLPGIHNVVGGICKFIMVDANPKITRGDFLISMK